VCERQHRRFPGCSDSVLEHARAARPILRHAPTLTIHPRPLHLWRPVLRIDPKRPLEASQGLGILPIDLGHHPQVEVGSGLLEGCGLFPLRLEALLIAALVADGRSLERRFAPRIGLRWRLGRRRLRPRRRLRQRSWLCSWAGVGCCGRGDSCMRRLRS